MLRVFPRLLYHWRSAWYVRLAIIVIILLLSRILGEYGALSLLLMGFAAGLAAVYGMARWPVFILVLFPLLLQFLPFSISTGTQSSLNIAIVIPVFLTALWIFDMVGKRSVRLADSYINTPALAVVVTTTISLLFGNLSLDVFASTASLPSQLGGWAIISFSMAIMLLVANRVQTPNALRWIVWSFMVASGGYIFVKYIGNTVFVFFFQEGGQGSLLYLWLIALSGGQLLFNPKIGPLLKFIYSVLFLATLVSGWLGREWASGWFPGLAVVVCLVYLKNWRLGLGLSAVVLLVVLFFGRDFIEGVLSGDQYSINTRLEAAQIIVGQIFTISPLLGLGPSNYYFYTPLFPILGYYVRFNSHNQYVDIVAQIGALGLLFLVWLFAALVWTGFKLRRRELDDFSKGYVNAALAGLGGMLAAGMLGDWFLPFVYNIGLVGYRTAVMGWVFLGGLVAVDHFSKPEPEKPKAPVANGRNLPGLIK